MKIKLTSKDRYRASAREKLLHGGNTVTVFWVDIDGKQSSRSATGYGKTPAIRKAYALASVHSMIDQFAASVIQ